MSNPYNQQPTGGHEAGGRPDGYSQGHGQQQPQGYPGQAAPGYGQQGYSQQNHAQQNYAQQAPYGGYGGGMYQQAGPEERPGTLGLVAMSVVVIAGVVLAVVAWMMGQQIGELFATTNLDPEAVDPDELANDPRFREWITRAGVQWNIVTFSVLGGIVGWVLSIVATATRRGRSFGIVGIIVGIAAPLIAVATFFGGMWPYISQMAG